MIDPNIPEQIRGACRQFRALEIDAVIGVGTPSHATLRPYRNYVRAAIYLAEALESCDFDNIPDEPLNKVISRTHAVHSALVAMGSQHSLGGNKDGVINTLTTSYQQWFADVSPIIAFSRARGSDLHALETQAREARDRLAALQLEGEEIHRALKALEVTNVVSKQASFFADQAKAHKFGGTIWLFVLLVVSALLVGGAVYTMFYPPEPTDKASLIVSQWAPRIALASILFWGLALCSRNYRAHRHNEVTNRHRALSLQTFNVFVTSAEEPAVRSAILAQAASTIFSATPSGYSPDQADPLPHVTAVELLQKLAK